MSIDIRLPSINSTTEQGQMAQMKSYLYQLVEQLNWALNTIEAGAVQNTYEILKLSPASSSEPTEKEAQSTFNAIKSLIIKSADIVNAYYDSMKVRLDGDYVATSDFGRYRDTTSADISANSTAIEQLYSDVQTVESSVVGISNSIIEVKANIKTGLLYTDGQGVPVYGLEVGQRNTEGGVETFKKYARFTSNRLSFYDQNDTEVAYISDYKLYITNAQITGSITLGRYVADTSDGISFKWV